MRSCFDAEVDIAQLDNENLRVTCALMLIFAFRRQLRWCALFRSDNRGTSLAFGISLHKDAIFFHSKGTENDAFVRVSCRDKQEKI